MDKIYEMKLQFFDLLKFLDDFTHFPVAVHFSHVYTPFSPSMVLYKNGVSFLFNLLHFLKKGN